MRIGPYIILICLHIDISHCQLFINIKCSSTPSSSVADEGVVTTVAGDGNMGTPAANKSARVRRKSSIVDRYRNRKAPLAIQEEITPSLRSSFCSISYEDSPTNSIRSSLLESNNSYCSEDYGHEQLEHQCSGSVNV